jgi:GNAT superfamily N-acetyltransferase
VEVNRGRSPDADDFVELPFLMHADQPQWVPPFRRDTRKALARRHRFFEHSEGVFYLVRRGGQPVGRIAVLRNRRYNRHRDRRDAFFAFFECVDDVQAASALFDAARQWAAHRGLERLKGPQGFNAMGGGGILVAGFEHRSAMTMMPWNPPYYARLLEECGFETHSDYYSASLDPQTFVMPERIRRVASRILDRGRFRVPALRSRSDVRRYAYRIGEIFNRAWVDHEDSAPLTEEEIDELASGLLLVADPSLVKVLLYDEEPVGFLLAFPDLSSALQRGAGHLYPWNLVDLAVEKRRTRSLIINGLGILPEYQRLGANALMYHELERSVRDQRRSYESAELLQVQDSTAMMLSDMNTLGANVGKTHRVSRTVR